MDSGLYRKVVDECAALGIRHVRLHNYGEPFVDRQLTEKVALRQAAGHRRGRRHQQRIADRRAGGAGGVEAGLDAINISVDASGREVFERTRVGLKYDKVIANIERLVAHPRRNWAARTRS